MSENNSSSVSATEAKEKQNSQKDLIIYPLSELAGGIYKAYFSTYIALLMTSVYVFPVALAGLLESLQSLVGWVAQPIFGVFMDHFSFKKSKYWPWFVLTGVGSGIVYILIFSIPIFTKNPAIMAFPVACLIGIVSIMGSALGQVGLNIYAGIAKDSKARASLAYWSKFTRDGMKVLVGFIFPLMLAAFLKMFNNSNVQAWALTAVILAGAAMILYFVVAVITKSSDLEKEAMISHKEAKQKAKKLSMSVVIKSILTNPAVLVAFIALTGSKVFFFFHITGGAFFWRYYMNNFTMMAAFSTAFSLAAIVGAVVATPLFIKYTKDTKFSFVLAFAIQAVLYGVSMVIVKKDAAIMTIFILSCTSFFNGITDSLILSLFAGAVDYANWKYGSSEPGLTMSVYALAVRVGMVLSVALRTYFLAAGGFDSAALAKGAAVPSGVMSALYNMNTLYPLIICVVITVLVQFVYPINDKKLAEIRNELKARAASGEGKG